ncbi:DUF808 domain-containing protein [Pleionea sediminis]|uniref:DUF808 domain-containing protein n=1 Tax=Pleionea sediminis TaxID=2569479 RepID=UPI0011851EFE|nr:DUF808 domain-containing protein [Pleionea sediminis]
MPGASLLTLLDDISTVLDDVAAMTKVAARKTAGVLGDDLALNAEQVSGVRAEREIPVVWAVAKGSFINKLILVPAALLISVFVPVLITPLLMIGGAYLCFEGVEKLLHKIFHSKEELEQKERVRNALHDPSSDMVTFEKEKIKGAIRTDFILSAEIIVIALGTVQNSPFITQVGVVSGIALFMTVFVYGLVAGIVKLDDAGLYLVKDLAQSTWAGFKRAVGRGLLIFAPFLMKMLAFVGTLAMFLVGGGILVHGVPLLTHWDHALAAQAKAIPTIGNVITVISPLVFSAVMGVLAGLVVVLILTGVKKLMPTRT